MTIADAVRGAQQGDEQAFAEIYRTYRPRVRNQCMFWTKNAETADDLTQDVFLQVLVKISQFRGDAAFSTWLFRLTFNTFLMSRRRHKNYHVVSFEEAGGMGQDGAALPLDIPEPDLHLEGVVERVTLERAISDLPQRMQRIVRMHDMEGLQHREIAQQLGHSIGNSKSQLFKARRKLRAALRPKRRLPR